MKITAPQTPNAAWGTKLTLDEFIHAAGKGILRRVSAIENNRQNPWGKTALNQWGIDVESCAAELLVAKSLGRMKDWYSFSENPSQLPGDVGRLQVRHTHWPNGRLRLQERDSESAIWILVTDVWPNQGIRGWTYGHVVKQPVWWSRDGEEVKCGDGRPAFFLPQECLYPMSTLPE